MSCKQRSIGNMPLNSVDNVSYSNCYVTGTHPLLFHPQASREPLPAAAINEIFEDVKDMGVLIGKGGIYGQVTALNLCPCVSLFHHKGCYFVENNKLKSL